MNIIIYNKLLTIFYEKIISMYSFGMTTRDIQYHLEEIYNIEVGYATLKKTNLKEMHIVRYADDFKIFCRNYNDAKKVFTAVKDWLETRLKLEISPEKSQITNLKKNYSEFLGIKFKVVRKKKRVIKNQLVDKLQTLHKYTTNLILFTRH